ncbi:adenosine kinase [Tamlana sp. 2201CG12-4]|uniref:adenosine kinase n=1 Tax=Tamlana sp. 2201CG12-4 TaxID=3112582 RepID=UPI002DBD9F52|nr:adenosine kinase [Tamlana sp. 2201CG12-4]MEC3906738.1 adenosine kinase [Tamlana sp. 2201CG12-4]
MKEENPRRLMKIIVIIFISLFVLGCENDTKNQNSYMPQRDDLIGVDKKRSFDSSLILSQEEVKLESKLIALRDLFEKNIKLNHQTFYIEPFSNVKGFIEATTLFEVFKAMPKGALLHTHSGGVTDIKWVIEKAKTLPNCYVYAEFNNKNILYGQLGVFQKNKVPSGYVSLKESIETDPDFESELYNLLVLKRSTLKKEDDYWLEFEKRFMRIMPLINYRPFFKAYYKKAFLDLIEDHINHVEIRFIFGNLYDERNTSYPIDTMVEDLKEVVLEIGKTNPSFSLNLIYTSFKFLSVDKINNQIKEAFRLKKKFPNLITGFDLVAEEDRGNSIEFYEDCWKTLDSLEQETGYQLPLFLHAGESHSVKNKNLYDAVLLNSKRIGHGLNLVLYPSLIEAVKKRDVLIEVNPLSNKILGYFTDLRNHPARILLNKGVQCAISSDDPGVFGYEGLSYDFFIAFVAWELDLKAIKKLVFNSVEYSTHQQKQSALDQLKKEWEAFVFHSIMLLESKNLN